MDWAALHASLEGTFNAAKEAIEQGHLQRTVGESAQKVVGVVGSAIQDGQAQVAVEDILQGPTDAIRQAIESGHLQRGFEEAVTEDAPHAFEKVRQWAENNPKAAICLGIGVGLVIVPGIVSGPALALTGFTGEGVAAGSIAAGTHASIGNVAAGSAFATLQSAGAGGAGLAAVNGIVQAAGGAAVAVGLREWLAKKDTQESLTIAASDEGKTKNE